MTATPTMEPPTIDSTTTVNASQAITEAPSSGNAAAIAGAVVAVLLVVIIVIVVVVILVLVLRKWATMMLHKGRV